MKKSVLAVLIVMVLTTGIFAQSPNQGFGVISELTGTVELKAAAAADYVPARTGARVEQDTIISTGFKSTALVTVGSTTITVRPLTRLTLTEISAAQGTETINVNLQAGRVRVDLSPPAGTKASMSVTAPMAVASVRGTTFEFDTRNINVHQGRVGFRGNTGYVVQVSAGSFSGVDSYGTAWAPRRSSDTGLASSRPVGFDSTASNVGVGVVPNESKGSSGTQGSGGSGGSSGNESDTGGGYYGTTTGPTTTPTGPVEIPVIFN